MSMFGQLSCFQKDIYACNRSRCAFCRENCPSYQNFKLESFSARGRMSIARAILEGTLGFSDELAKNIFTCTSCQYCFKRCRMDTVEIIKTVKVELIERGFAPPKIRDFLENIIKHGNPFGESRNKRGEWVNVTNIKKYEPSMDFLFYVGCVGSYDKRANEAVRALGALLAELGFSFGVLGDAENCDGNEVNMVGEKGLFQLLVEKNVQQFKALNIKKVIAFSPHAYNIFKNEYPKYGGNFEAIHYTQLLREIVKSGKLHFSKKLNVCVTYHDPCFLGRYNEEYNAPREVLKSIPGVKLIEMERNKQYSLCCGGGGGNFYTGYLNGRENSPNRIRVREAYETGAEILAVSCPICLIMLDDAVKSEGLEDKLIVQEISEIVKDAL